MPNLIHGTVYIHDTSVIDTPCHIGANTKIWHFCHVMSGAHIGKDCMIGQSVYVGGHAFIGNGVRIQNNVSVYDGIFLEDDIFIGPSVTFTDVKRPRAWKRGYRLATCVQKGVTIGGGSVILPGVLIGEYAFIGAGAVVTKHVPANALMVGNPARQVGEVNQEGESI